MRQKMKLIGLKRFKGAIDGQHFDFCKMRFLLPVDASSADELGFGAVEFECGSSAEFERYAKLAFPSDVEVELEVVVRGKRTVHQVAAVHPLGGKLPNA